MRKGLKALDTAIAESAKGGGSYQGRLGFFNLKADESVTVRFLTELDDTITTDFYEFIQDNKGKGQNFVVSTDYYEDPTATDWVLELGGQQVDYQTKDLGDPQPKTKTVAIAVVLKETVTEGKNGRPQVGFEDLWEEVEARDPSDKDGKKTKKYEARKFIVIRQAYKNFWQPLRTLHDEYGSICDRPYKIKRSGKSTDTNYNFIARKEDDGWEYMPEDKSATESPSYKALHETYGYGTDKTDVPDDERFAYCPQTLEEWIEDSCSEGRVKFFLGSLEDREKKEKGGSSDSDSTPDTPTATANDDGDEAQAAPPPASNGSGKKGTLAERLAAHK